MADYVIVTPAFNEEQYIGRTIHSVVSQSKKPLAWVIVNDGSTDMTRQVVEAHIEKFHFIRLVNVERDGGHGFGFKSLAFSRGVAEISDLQYDFIGNLDADISIDPEYFERILSEFEADPGLGIAGGIVYTKSSETIYTRDRSSMYVAGAVQLFRRECFEAVGGYLPLKCGGEDSAASIKARMLGWRVRKFFDLKAVEARRTGTSLGGPLRARYSEGKRFHSLGYTPLFFLFRSMYRIVDPPYIIGSMASFFGYIECMFKRSPVLLPPDVAGYLRTEQRGRLMKFLSAPRPTRHL